MKKLLFVWQGLNHGGGETALINLTSKLNDKYSITVLCLENINKYQVPENINLIFLAAPSNNKIVKIYHKILFFFKWFNLARNNELQIINEGAAFTIMAWLVSILLRKKYFLWEHSCRSEMTLGGVAFSRKIYRKELSKANCIICVSEYCANSLQEFAGTTMNNTKVIHNILYFQAITQQKLLLENVINICAVGRITHEKNFPLLINALAQVIPEISKKVHLYICGRKDDEDLITNLIKNLNLQHYVTLTGHVNNTLSYINQCDILVSSSNSEALPTVVLEALYCNKAVIATRTGAAEILENGKYGVVVEKRNQDELVKALTMLINDNSLRENYAKNSKNALKRFDQEIAIDKWCKLIKSRIS